MDCCGVGDLVGFELISRISALASRDKLFHISLSSSERWFHLSWGRRVYDERKVELDLDMCAWMVSMGVSISYDYSSLSSNSSSSDSSEMLDIYKFLVLLADDMDESNCAAED